MFPLILYKSLLAIFILTLSTFALTESSQEPSSSLSVDSEVVCKDASLVKLKELVKVDKDGILQHQFQLTAAKTALYLKQKLDGRKNVSWEKYINEQQGKLNNNEAVKKAVEFYNGFQKGNDYSEIASVEDGILKNKYSYYQKDSRLYNEDASKFYLLLADQGTAQTGVKFGMEDSAIAWMFHKLSESKNLKKGNPELNMLNLSNHVNRYMGSLVAGGTDASEKDLQEIMDKEKAFIRDQIADVMKGLEVCKGFADDECVLGELHTQMFAKDINEITKNIPLSKNGEISSYLGKPKVEEQKIYVPSLKVKPQPKEQIRSYQHEEKKNLVVGAPLKISSNTKEIIVVDKTAEKKGEIKRNQVVSPKKLTPVTLNVALNASQCCGKDVNASLKCLRGVVSDKVDQWMKLLYKKHSVTYLLASGDYAESFKNETLNLSKLCSVKLNFTSHSHLFGMMREGQFDISIAGKNGKAYKSRNSETRTKSFNKRNDLTNSQSGYFESYLNGEGNSDFIVYRKFLSEELTDCLAEESLLEKGKPSYNNGITFFLQEKNGPSCKIAPSK